MKKLQVSVGVFAYNEAFNIAKVLNALLNQKQDFIKISEILVVSSASTDGTDEIVLQISKKNPIVKLISEKERNGKSSAINKFIKAANSDILVIESADTIPNEDCVQRMVLPFLDEKIGMSGGRPIPENNPDTFVGFAVTMMWRMHHKMAMISPKLGEMVAFRKVFDQIPPESAVDEASIEAIIRAKGYDLYYEPQAIIHNKGPETIPDFVKQRRRIAAGHLWLIDTQKYEVVSQKKGLLLTLLIDEIIANPFKIHFIVGTMILEVLGRFLGYYDYKIKKKNPFKWEMIKTSKKLKKS